MEEKFYDKHYHIKNYQNHQLRFCIVVPSYNNVKYRLYLRNLDSLFMQDYQNYHIVYIDDHSPDQTGDFVKKYIQEKNIPQDKIKVIVNDVNKKAMQNIFEKIHEECPDGEIVGLIDGDDSFNGRQVLKLYNALFHQKKAALIYSNFLKITSNSRT
jgi:glycosyltransferase involved in cell wall biosynthesis